MIGSDRSRSTCQPESPAGSPSGDPFGARFRSPDRREPLSALSGDQRFKPHADESRLLPHSGQFGSLLERLVIDVECSSHTYNDAILVCSCQGCQAAGPHSLSVLIVGGKFGIKRLSQGGLPVFRRTRRGRLWIARLRNWPKSNVSMMFCRKRWIERFGRSPN